MCLCTGEIPTVSAFHHTWHLQEWDCLTLCAPWPDAVGGTQQNSRETFGLNQILTKPSPTFYRSVDLDLQVFNRTEEHFEEKRYNSQISVWNLIRFWVQKKKKCYRRHLEGKLGKFESKVYARWFVESILLFLGMIMVLGRCKRMSSFWVMPHAVFRGEMPWQQTFAFCKRKCCVYRERGGKWVWQDVGESVWGVSGCSLYCSFNFLVALKIVKGKKMFFRRL